MLKNSDNPQKDQPPRDLLRVAFSQIKFLDTILQYMQL